MYQFCYHYINAKFVEKAKLCYMDRDSFILYIKTDDIKKKTLQKMLKLDYILQIMNQIDHYQKENSSKNLLDSEQTLAVT